MPYPPADCGNLTGQTEASASLTLRENAGVGAVLDSVSMTLCSQATGAVIASGTFQGAGLVQQAGGSTRIEAHGSRTISIGVHYDQSLGGHPATLSVAAQATDDHGHGVSANTSAGVHP